MGKAAAILVTTIVVLLAALAAPASAQQTRAQLNAYNSGTFGANGSNAITGPEVNTMNSQMINSFGALNDANVWSKTNVFNGTTAFNGPLNFSISTACSTTLVSGTVCVNPSGFVVTMQ